MAISHAPEVPYVDHDTFQGDFIMIFHTAKETEDIIVIPPPGCLKMITQTRPHILEAQTPIEKVSRRLRILHAKTTPNWALKTPAHKIVP